MDVCCVNAHVDVCVCVCVTGSVPSTPSARDDGEKESVARQLLREKKLSATSISMKR